MTLQTYHPPTETYTTRTTYGSGGRSVEVIPSDRGMRAFGGLLVGCVEV